MPIPEGQGPWRGTRNFKYVWLSFRLPLAAGALPSISGEHQRFQTVPHGTAAKSKRLLFGDQKHRGPAT